MKFCIIGLLIGLLWTHEAYGATHSLKYFYTGSSEVPNFPEFVVVGLLDDVQFFHFDSNSQQAIAKQDWLNKLAETNPQYFQRETQNLQGTHQSFRGNIDIVKQRFNQTGGVHTFQFMYGCEWDDETPQKNGYMQYGYDGEDFIALETKDFQYVAPIQQAEITKRKWNNDKAFLESAKHYLTQQCIEWLKKYVMYGKATLQKQVSPEVTLFEKDDVSKVACQATGFYPDGVMITWKKDGKEIEEDVDVGETLPNEDGTFQKRAVLAVSTEDRKKSQYTCEVAHKNTEPIVITLTEKAGISLGIIIGCVAVAALVLISVVVFVMMKKKDYKKAEQSDTDSENSNPIARKGAECGDC